MRAWLRRWLGIYDCPSFTQFRALRDVIADMQKERGELIGRMDSFTNALKAKAQQVPRPARTFDYESSQIAALEEFKEK